MLFEVDDRPPTDGSVLAVLQHVTLTAARLDVSLAFYDAALAPLGLTRAVDFPDEEDAEYGVDAAGYGTADTVLLWVVRGLEPTRNAHVALTAPDRAAVEAFHDAAVAEGGTSRRAPRRWAIYRQGYFGAIVTDPDGNLIEASTTE